MRRFFHRMAVKFVDNNLSIHFYLVCFLLFLIGLVTETTFWGDVVVTPLEAAYTDKVMDPLFAEEVNSQKEKSVGMDL